MRTFTLFLFTLLTLGAAAQTVYVDAAAAGSNNGTSWADAYTDLADALNNAAAGSDVWLAAGTYTPGDGSTDTAYYRISADLQLYGGFAGTESSPDERDIAANPTVLSGDVNGDDIVGEFNLNKDDNLRKLVVVDTSLARVVFDGLTVQGGDAELDTDNFPRFWTRGAGIYAQSPLTVQNCTFTGNRADRAAGVYLIDGASGSEFYDNVFTQSSAQNRGIGIYGFDIDDLVFERCQFVQNPNALRGGLNLLRSDNLRVDECVFQDNQSNGFSSGLYLFNCRLATLSNSLFDGLTGGTATGMYIDGRDLDTTSLTITNCVLSGNATITGVGPAIVANSARVNISNTSFRDNVSADSDPSSSASGGALYIGGTSRVEVVDSEFLRNETTGDNGFGGAVAMYGDEGIFRRCQFNNNSTERSGGAMIVAFQNAVTIDSCLFANNNADFGGALFVQNDSTTFDLDRSTFDGNSANNNGGAIAFTSGVLATLDDCTFVENNADFGGAINIGADSALIDQFSLRNLIFRANDAANQGGAINASNVNGMLMENILATENIAFGNGVGGFLSNNATTGSVSSITMRNVTAANNVANVSDVGGAALMQWEADETAEASITLQNALLFEQIENYKIEQGTPTVTSAGGNIYTDETLADALTASTDQLVGANTPIFTDADGGDFSLQAGSPAIDGGVDDGMLPATDLAGNPRVQGDAVDVGAYEAQPVGTYDPQLAEQFRVWPNPTADVVTITMADTWTGRAELRVYDNQQRLLRTQTFAKAAGQHTQLLDLRTLPTGSYHIVLQLADRHATQTVVRR